MTLTQLKKIYSISLCSTVISLLDLACQTWPTAHPKGPVVNIAAVTPVPALVSPRFEPSGLRANDSRGEWASFTSEVSADPVWFGLPPTAQSLGLKCRGGATSPASSRRAPPPFATASLRDGSERSTTSGLEHCGPATPSARSSAVSPPPPATAVD
jgi:hypothetical protein